MRAMFRTASLCAGIVLLSIGSPWASEGGGDGQSFFETEAGSTLQENLHAPSPQRAPSVDGFEEAQLFFANFLQTGALVPDDDASFSYRRTEDDAFGNPGVTRENYSDGRLKKWTFSEDTFRYGDRTLTLPERTYEYDGAGRLVYAKVGDEEYYYTHLANGGVRYYDPALGYEVYISPSSLPSSYEDQF